MRKAQSCSIVFMAMLAGAFCTFARLAYLADMAMPKTGEGNLPEFERLSRLAGFAFWAAIVFWGASVIAAQLSPQPFRGRALLLTGLLIPIASFVAYFVFLAP